MTESDASQTLLPAPLTAGLVELGLVDDGTRVAGRPLTGGVSSDVWRAELPDGPVCVKRALEQLRVAATWTVSTDRSSFEAAWFDAANRTVPELACPLVGYAARGRVLVLSWLDPATCPVWKSELAGGRVDAAVGATLGARLARLHGALADASRYRSRFQADGLFAALRLDPYLRTTAERHPTHAAELHRLRERTASTAHTVIHGDVSPKNVLVTPDGPVLIDAECACWGDPAFDLAFCANHLLLKAVWLPALAAPLRAAFDAFTRAYLAGVSWEPAAELEARAATLLPALALARVDGASPVEYLTEDRGRPLVRAVAGALLHERPSTLDRVADRWFAAATTDGAADHAATPPATSDTTHQETNRVL